MFNQRCVLYLPPTCYKLLKKFKNTNKLFHDYLTNNSKYLEQYDYFYIPDDDIFIDDVNIHRLFEYMEEFGLAFPSLRDFSLRKSIILGISILIGQRE